MAWKRPFAPRSYPFTQRRLPSAPLKAPMYGVGLAPPADVEPKVTVPANLPITPTRLAWLTATSVAVWSVMAVALLSWTVTAQVMSPAESYFATKASEPPCDSRLMAGRPPGRVWKLTGVITPMVPAT